VKISIHQPAYLPWLGHYDRLRMVDLHVDLDHVQFEKNSFINRNRIRTPQGWTWLTVPVETAGRFGALPIDGVRQADQRRWPEKHWRTILANYARSPGLRRVGDELEALLRADSAADSAEPPGLGPLLARTDQWLQRQLGVATPRVSSRTLGIQSSKSQLVLDICLKLGADHYVSGPLGLDYLDLAAFASAGVTVTVHRFHHPTWTQRWPGFEPNLSALDYLLCAEGDAAPTWWDGA
jgi:hypothetical protein